MRTSDRSSNAIKEFMSNCGAKDGVKIHVLAEAFQDGNLIYYDSAEIYCAYNIGYMQYDLSVYWNINDDSMRKLGLHGKYNTNFQEFTYSDNTLTILADDITIYFSKN